LPFRQLDLLLGPRGPIDVLRGLHFVRSNRVQAGDEVPERAAFGDALDETARAAHDDVRFDVGSEAGNDDLQRAGGFDIRLETVLDRRGARTVRGDDDLTARVDGLEQTFVRRYGCRVQGVEACFDVLERRAAGDGPLEAVRAFHRHGRIDALRQAGHGELERPRRRRRPGPRRSFDRRASRGEEQDERRDGRQPESERVDSEFHA
jgi:hypothetical protein